MIKKNLTLSLLLVCFLCSGIAQNASVFYLEGGGTGIFETLNYEKNSVSLDDHSGRGRGIRFGVGLYRIRQLQKSWTKIGDGILVLLKVFKMTFKS